MINNETPKFDLRVKVNHACAHCNYKWEGRKAEEYCHKCHRKNVATPDDIIMEKVPRPEEAPFAFPSISEEGEIVFWPVCKKCGEEQIYDCKCGIDLNTIEEKVRAGLVQINDQKFITELAKVLNCLPSYFVGGNKHMIEAAKKLRDKVDSETDN